MRDEKRTAAVRALSDFEALAVRVHASGTETVNLQGFVTWEKPRCDDLPGNGLHDATGLTFLDPLTTVADQQKQLVLVLYV
jgi:hypothetical protein